MCIYCTRVPAIAIWEPKACSWMPGSAVLRSPKSESRFYGVMTSSPQGGYRKRPTNIQHAEPDSGPWSLTKNDSTAKTGTEDSVQNLGMVGFKHMHTFSYVCLAIALGCLAVSRRPPNILRNPVPEASPRPAHCIWVLDDPIVRGKRFRLQCKAPKENLEAAVSFCCPCFLCHFSLDCFGVERMTYLGSLRMLKTRESQAQWLALALRSHGEEALVRGGHRCDLRPRKGLGGRENRLQQAVGQTLPMQPSQQVELHLSEAGNHYGSDPPGKWCFFRGCLVPHQGKWHLGKCHVDLVGFRRRSGLSDSSHSSPGSGDQRGAEKRNHLASCVKCSITWNTL